MAVLHKLIVYSGVFINVSVSHIDFPHLLLLPIFVCMSKWFELLLNH